MIVKVEFTVETEDFGKEEFKKEIKNLIEDIDGSGVHGGIGTQLLTFDMYKI